MMIHGSNVVTTTGGKKYREIGVEPSNNFGRFECFDAKKTLKELMSYGPFFFASGSYFLKLALVSLVFNIPLFCRTRIFYLLQTMAL